MRAQVSRQKKDKESITKNSTYGGYCDSNGPLEIESEVKDENPEYARSSFSTAVTDNNSQYGY